MFLRIAKRPAFLALKRLANSFAHHVVEGHFPLGKMGVNLEPFSNEGDSPEETSSSMATTASSGSAVRKA
jgi:hypothetical protein